jgi:hypothetical protein
MGWKSAVSASALVVLAVPFAASPAASQTYGFLRVGNATYDGGDDPFCQDPTAFLTLFSAGFTTPLVGVSAELNNDDYPWPTPPPGSGNQEEAFLTHGRSIQLMAEVNPLHLVAGGVSRYARPFIGVGLSISSDGETRPDTGAGPTHSVKGQTRPFVAYGVNGLLPLGDRFGLTAGYRGTSVFYGDFEIETPTGAAVTSDGETLSSKSWTFGLVVRLGS